MKNQNLNTFRDKSREPFPPNPKSGEHHWLGKYDIDGHYFGLVVLQWNPGARRWSHSGNLGTWHYVDTRYWKYVSPCPMPDC